MRSAAWLTVKVGNAAEPYHSLVKVVSGSGRVAHPDVRLEVDAVTGLDAHGDNVV